MPAREAIPDWLKIVAIVVPTIGVCIGGLFTALSVVEEKISAVEAAMHREIAEHAQRPHDGTVTREEYTEDLHRVEARLDRIERKIDRLVLRSARDDDE